MAIKINMARIKTPTHDEIYDQIMKNSQLFQALVKALNNGDFVPGSNLNKSEIKQAIKGNMNGL